MSAPYKEYLDENTFSVDKKDRLLSSAVIYGTNASGKSNFFQALAFFFRCTISSGPKLQIGDHIDTEPFLFAKKTRNAASTFELIFFRNGIRYRYGRTLRFFRFARNSTEKRRSQSSDICKIIPSHPAFPRAVDTQFLDIDNGSAGTRKLFEYTGSIPETLERGIPLFIDEFDSCLHPLIIEGIIKLFNSPVTNPKHAQLVISCHARSQYNDERTFPTGSNLVLWKGSIRSNSVSR